jgi:carboxymethylenebutenolidase
MADLMLPSFVVRPSGLTQAPGLVMAHDSNGLGASHLRVAERLGRAGYFVAAPDLYFRVGGPEAASWETLRPQLEEAQVDSDLEGAAQTLRDLGATSVGIIGFCYGGSLAYRMAIQRRTFAAAVSFYGISLIDSLGEPRCPVKLFYGRQDRWLAPEKLEKVLTHHPADTVVYPNAGHAFLHGEADEVVEDAASDAWTRTMAFFAEHLGP